MYTPTAGGGHALYTAELLTALTRHANGGARFELVSSRDLQEAFRSNLYPVNAILPELANRSEFSSLAGWAVNRVLYYPRRDGFFLRWLETRPDITAVHLQEYVPWNPVPLFRGIRRLGRKVIYTVHNLYQHTYPPLIPKSHWYRLSRKAWRMADCLIVHTPELAERLSQFLGEGHPPIHVVPHGVGTLHAPAQIPPLQERLNWKRLLFFGTIRRNKRLELLLDAAESLPGYSLTVAGAPTEPDYFDNDIRPRIDRLQAKGLPVTLIDRFTSDEEAGELFARHSAIVLPYTKQFASQSGVVFLALAHEMPVIASDMDGLRGLFRQFPVGVSVSDMTPSRLSSAIHAFFDGNHRDELVGQMRAAKQYFSWDSAAGLTLDAYASCMKGFAGR
jgi:glycosyltransferase involved in cell wall biosynthesis